MYANMVSPVVQQMLWLPFVLPIKPCSTVILCVCACIASGHVIVSSSIQNRLEFVWSGSSVRICHPPQPPSLGSTYTVLSAISSGECDSNAVLGVESGSVLRL